MPDHPSAVPFAAIACEAMARLAEAREAWLAFFNATTVDEHFEAVERLQKALAVTPEEITND